MTGSLVSGAKTHVLALDSVVSSIHGVFKRVIKLFLCLPVGKGGVLGSGAGHDNMLFTCLCQPHRVGQAQTSSMLDRNDRLLSIKDNPQQQHTLSQPSASAKGLKALLKLVNKNEASPTQ